MIVLCILLTPVALANLLTIYVAWRRYMSTPVPVPATPSLGQQILVGEAPLLIAPADQLLADIGAADGDLAKDAAAVGKFLAVETTNEIPAFGVLSTLAVHWLKARADAWLARKGVPAAPATPAS